ncbi:MAG: phosphoribosyl-ATP diphosphatase [Planctomycetota bacterium]
MLVPSIDLINGNAVQLVGGDPTKLEIDAGDPRPLAETYGRLGEIAVIDLDAALGPKTGNPDNAATIGDLLTIARCRVGGGIRDVDTAIRWLDAGAHTVILGTAATPEILRELPSDRVIAALDARDGEIVVEGWTKAEGRGSLNDRIAELREYVSGFLVTFVEREGRLGGTDLERAQAVVEAAGDKRVTIAGGVTTADEIRRLDEIGADAQVGMAIYSGKLDLAEAFAGPLRTDRDDGLWPTVVVDERGVALGLAYSSAASLAEAVRTGRGVYYSRSRQGLWRKGDTSGEVQQLLRIDMDCDRDALRFTVKQLRADSTDGVFCHLGTRSCWGDDGGLGELARRLAAPAESRDAKSYTTRLLTEPGLLDAKLREEAEELCRAASRDDIVHEAADVLYFTLVRLAKEGIALDEVERHLDRRALKVSRRRGDAKAKFVSGKDTNA